VSARRASIAARIGVAIVLAGGALLMQARAARAWSFAEEVPEDPCARARSYEPQDHSEQAQHARRSCRLQAFDRQLNEARRQELASEQRSREAWVQTWVEKTQPARVIHPMAIEGFVGSGIVNYGLTFSWDVLRHLELGAHLGQRQMSCVDQTFGTTADCTRTTWGAGARWFLLDKNFAPFVGAAFSSTSAPLKIVHQDQQTGQTDFLQGNGRAHSAGLSAGFQFAYSYVRVSLEYIYEYLFYTGASKNDMQLTPSEDLRKIWEDSLKQDQHGVRLQVGLAF